MTATDSPGQVEPGRDVVPAGFQQATAKLHAAARWWIVTALAGVGAVLVAGVPLTGLGGLRGLQLVLAVVALLVALVSIGTVIPYVARVFTTPYITFAELQTSDWPRRYHQSAKQAAQTLKAVEDNREELFGDHASDLGWLYLRLRQQNKDLRSQRGGERPHQASHNGASAVALSPAKKRSAHNREEPVNTDERPTSDVASESLVELRAAAARVVDFANYEATRQRFVSLYWKLAVAGLITTLGVGVYAYLVSQPHASDAVTAPTPVLLQLPPTAAVRAQLGPDCVLSRVQAVAESGSLSMPTVVTIPTATCNGARFTVPRGTIVVPARGLPTLNGSP
jgi:hypothetical protein